MYNFSNRLSRIQPSATLAMTAKAAELKRKPITVRHIETKQILSFTSHREMARQLNIDRSTLCRHGKTKGWELV